MPGAKELFFFMRRRRGRSPWIARRSSRSAWSILHAALVCCCKGARHDAADCTTRPFTTPYSSHEEHTESSTAHTLLRAPQNIPHSDVLFDTYLTWAHRVSGVSSLSSLCCILVGKPQCGKRKTPVLEPGIPLTIPLTISIGYFIH